jgi:hypothetical protein
MGGVERILHTFKTWHKMEVSGYCHAVAALLLEKDPDTSV